MTRTTTVSAVLAVTAATAAWAVVVGPATPIVKDTLEFLERIVNDDRHWARVLDVRVKIDTAVLRPSALAVLRGLDAIRPEHDEARRARRSPSSKTLTDDAAAAATTTTVVTVTALDVIVEATTVHYREGGALDLAMSALASAVRCNALPPIAAQVRAVGVRADAAGLTAVLNNLIAYADKLVRLKDPLAAEPELFAEWLTVIGRAGTDRAAAVDTSAMSRLLRGHLSAACDPQEDHDDYNGDEDATAAYDAAQETLNVFARDFKVGAMDGRTWRHVLDVPRALSTANRSVFGEDGPASVPVS